MGEKNTRRSSRRRILREGEPIYVDRPDGPRLGDAVWDLRPLILKENVSEARIDLTTVVSEYRESVEDLLLVLTRPDHPVVVRAGIVRRAKPVAPSALFSKFYSFRIIGNWGQAHGLVTFANWTQSDADAFLASVQAGTHRGNPSALRRASGRDYVTALKQIREFGDAISGGGFSFVPWGSLPATHVIGHGQAIKTGNRTATLAWETWAPLVAGSWRIADRFSADILCAAEVAESLPEDAMSGVGAWQGWDVLSAWAANGGKVPFHTGFGRSPGSRGSMNLTLLCRKLGISPHLFSRLQYEHGRAALDLVNSMAADPKRSEMGGLITPSVMVEAANGSAHPWLDEIGLGETEYLVSVLRASCYVLLGALTGMRDSEIQALTKTSVTVQDGLPALFGRQYKGIEATEGLSRAWWAPTPVTRAVEVLSLLSRNPTHLFARSENNIGNYDAGRDVPRLISFINDSPVSRVGRGRGLGLKSIEMRKNRPINSRTLRQSFCVYAVTNPEAEIGLGIQLGHAAWRTTAGYVVDGQQEAAKLMSGTRIALARSQAEELITGQSPVAGAAAGRILEFRAQVVADPHRAKRISETVAEKLYFGIANDCMFNSGTAACGADGPHLGDHLCTGPDCSNALFREAHAELLALSLKRFDSFFAKGMGSPQLIARMRKDRAQIAGLLRQISGTAQEARS